MDRSKTTDALALVSGLDPAGRAGFLVDIATAVELGLHPVGALTSQTVQPGQSNTQQADTHSVAVASDLLQAQLSSIPKNQSEGRAVSAIKIGLVASVEQAAVIRQFIETLGCPSVWDPVYRSSSGFEFISRREWREVFATLAPAVNLVTLNVDERELVDDTLLRNCKAYLTTGGDLPGPDCVDRYYDDCHRFAMASRRITNTSTTSIDLAADLAADSTIGFAERNASPNLRGTGCALSTAIAAGFALGLRQHDAVVFAKAHVNRRIRGNGRVVPEDFPEIPLERTRPTPTSVPKSVPTPFHPIPEDLGPYPIVQTAAHAALMAEAGAKICQLRVKPARGPSGPRAMAGGGFRPAPFDSEPNLPLMGEVPSSGIKEDWDTDLRREIAAAKEACERRGCLLFVNDHWQLAIEYGVYGVHLGQEDIETADISAIHAAGLRLGISTHDYYEAARAKALRPSYIALGPIFPTTCKSMDFGPQGLPRVREWVTRLATPIIAIGGLTLDHVRDVKAAGAAGAAVISDILQAPDPRGRAISWVQRWQE